jgi:curved DNA-binding protein CbpA
MQETLYDILGVRPNCAFAELKRAYWAQAKRCHPDLFFNDAAKTAAFQRLVSAFDVLSDPHSRRNYDERLAFLERPPLKPHYHDGRRPILDSIADDILEEMIVGNTTPRHTTLQNLMLDLTNTERFIMFREAKTQYERGRYGACLRLCQRLVSLSPGNILYHYFLAEAAAKLRRTYRARKHYLICLQIGSGRMPPLRLHGIRRRYQALEQEQGWLGRVLAWLLIHEQAPELSEEEQTQQALERAFARELKKQQRLKRSTDGARPGESRRRRRLGTPRR